MRHFQSERIAIAAHAYAVAQRCLDLSGAEVERHYREARILGIGGGTTEIMNEVIAARLGL